LVQLKAVSKEAQNALNNKELLNLFAQNQHQFSFPIFDDLSEPWQTLKCIYFFNRANGSLPMRNFMEVNGKNIKIMDQRSSFSQDYN
jgi:hypothetical protein